MTGSPPPPPLPPAADDTVLANVSSDLNRSEAATPDGRGTSTCIDRDAADVPVSLLYGWSLSSSSFVSSSAIPCCISTSSPEDSAFAFDSSSSAIVRRLFFTMFLT